MFFYFDSNFDTKDPITCWKPYFHRECCVVPNLFVKHPKKTAGLGDNISATGLVF